MKATIPYVQEKFREYNQLIFNGELPEIPIQLSDAKGFLGVCKYKRRKLPDGTVERYDFRLSINARIDMPEDELDDIIIHEMIHYYIGVNKIADTSAHGRVFRQMMKTINEQYGRHITISHKYTDEQADQAYGTRPRWHAVAVVKFRDGRTGVKVLPRVARRIIAFRRNLLWAGGVKQVDLYLSSDPFFNRFPTSTALKIYYVDSEELASHLKDAQALKAAQLLRMTS